MTSRTSPSAARNRWTPLVLSLMAVAPITSIAAQPRENPSGKAVRVGTDGGATTAPEDSAGDSTDRGTRHGLPGEAYALIIGVGSFKDTSIDPLRACHRDAQRMYDILVDPEKGDFNPNNVRLLISDGRVTEATPAGHVRRVDVLRELRWIQQRAGEDDTVIIYFSGHGEVDRADGNKGYWIMGDTKLTELYGGGLSELDITDQISKIRARRLVTFVDACYANATVGEAGSNDRPKTKSVMDDAAVRDHVLQFTGEGRVIFSASDGSTPSIVVSNNFELEAARGYSLFTFHLTEALGGKADHRDAGGNADGVVELSEVVKYVSKRTLEDSMAMSRGDITGRIVPHRPVLRGELTDRFLLTTDFETLRKRTEVVDLLRDRGIELFRRGLITGTQLDDAMRLADTDPSELSKAEQSRREMWFKIARGIDESLIETLVKGMYGGGVASRPKADVPAPETDPAPPPRNPEPARVRRPTGREDDATLRRMLVDGAAGGDPDAMYFLGRAHWHDAASAKPDESLPPSVAKSGEGWHAAYLETVRDPGFSGSFSEGVELLTRAAGARSGHAAAAFDLALLLDSGLGVERDDAKAVEWYTAAAEKGHVGAMRNLGFMYQEGEGVPADMRKAVRWFEDAADAGDTVAAHRLGVIYQQGTGVDQDYAASLKWYRAAADLGHVPSMNQVGVIYDLGRGVRADAGRAAEWYERAATADEPSYIACINLAKLYKDGRGVPQDDEEAFGWYLKAADEGREPSAMSDVGLAYHTGRGVPKDYAKALRYFTLAAENDDADGIYAIGWYYDKGTGVPQSDAEAFRWYLRAAKRDHRDGMMEVAERYDQGNGTAADPAEALHWYRKAADAGLGKAMNRLGIVYDDGRLGQEIDEEEATRWYLRAAEAGYDWGMYNVATRYADGKGVEADGPTALRWFREAAEAGLPIAMNRMGLIYDRGSHGLSEDQTEATRWYRKAADAGDEWAMWNLAVQLEKGEGTPKNPQLALEWYKESAKKGNATAMYDVGRCYLSGIGASENQTYAFEWYFQAAENGSPEGMNAVGYMYDNGYGCTEDEREATRWYRRAAEAGSPVGMYNLGFQYEFGEGVERDRSAAVRWYQQAARKGHTNARERLEYLGERW